MVKVKICGLTNEADALAAAEAGADFLGFVFAPSPRQVEPELVRTIVGCLPQGVSTVGVFVDAPLQKVQSTLDFCHLDYAQLHGAEPPEYVYALAPRAIKAFPLRSRLEAEEQLLALEKAFAQLNSRFPLLLLDSRRPGAAGGTGELSDWALAREIASCHPVILAGGLKPENVAQAVGEVAPWGVDVSSGVERSPGLKDHGKICRFVRAAKDAVWRL